MNPGGTTPPWPSAPKSATWEPDSRGNFASRRIEFEPGDVAFVKNLIVDSYARIMRQEFYEGCGQTDCSWCNFLKRQQQEDSFADVEEEALDD